MRTLRAVKVPRALRLLAISLMLAASFLVIPSLQTERGPVCVGFSCVRGNPVIYDMNTTSYQTQVCNQNPIVQAFTRLVITKFSLDREAYLVGETANYAGSVEVWVDQTSQDCFGFLSTTSQQVSPQYVQMKVEILSSTQTFTPKGDGSFYGSYVIPVSQPGGDYMAYLTATFMGVTEHASAKFKVMSYSPELQIHYERFGIPDDPFLSPGEKIVLNGVGFLPFSPGIVDVDDKFNVTTDAHGNFQLEISIPEDDTFAEGNHTLTVTQAQLSASEVFQVRYRELLVSLDQPATIQQYGTFTVSGNITAQGTDHLVPGALVTITVFGKNFTVQTDNNGFFTTSISADSPPGTYQIAVSAIHAGYKPYVGSPREIRVLAAMNPTAIVTAVGAGAVAGASVSLAKRQIRRAKVHPHVALPRTDEFCIHCGLQIKRDSGYCPKCGLRLRGSRGLT